MRPNPKRGYVNAVGEIETHAEWLPCEACAEDVQESAPASNGGRLCVYCKADADARGSVKLWMPGFMEDEVFGFGQQDAA